MSINSRKLSDGRVVYDVRLRDPSGRQYKRTFRTKQEAEGLIADERSSQGRSTWIDSRQGKVQLGDYAEAWLTTRTGLRPRTRELYDLTLRLHLLAVLGEKELACFDHEQSGAQLVRRTLGEGSGSINLCEGLSVTANNRCYGSR